MDNVIPKKKDPLKTWPEKIVTYECSDGKVFDKYHEAQQYQRILEVEKWLDNQNFPVVSSRTLAQYLCKTFDMSLSDTEDES
jgi:hypothetical protein